MRSGKSSAAEPSQQGVVAPAAAATNAAPALQARIEWNLVEQLYGALPSILVNLTLMPPVVAAVFWGKASTAFLVAWLVAALLVLIVRFALARIYARVRPGAAQARVWAWYFTATSLASGLLWGVAGWALFNPAQTAAVIFLYVCVIGLAAGSIIVTSYWLPAFYAYAVPSLGLSIARLLLEGDGVYTSLAVLMLMYLAIISRVARRQNQVARELFALKFENEDLVRQLSQERDSALHMNEILDQRVRERTAELEREVATRKQAQEELYRIAHHDALTGLPNRLAFTKYLRQALAAQPAPELAVLFIDLDRFKEINDTLGHATGDAVLCAAARRLAQLDEAALFCARLGGDEFVVVLDARAGLSEVYRYARLCIERLSAGYEIDGTALFVSASIGICLAPGDGRDLDTLVRNADTAMYDAKNAGRNRYSFYRPEMTALATERARLERLLRTALDRGEMSLAYQIKVDAHGRPTGLETLLRWNSPELGAVSPAQFVPVAEETGFILRLGEWVLGQCCTQLAQWRERGLPIPQIAVNLSAKQVEDGDIVQAVRRALEQARLPAAFLELEITESALMSMSDGQAVLNDLSALGVRLAIDDFGTGYSSLAYLRHLPIDCLKIDRSFVSGLGQGSGDDAIVGAILALARSLDLKTVAEGVETPVQLQALRRLGVDEIQGYLYARAVPAQDVPALWQRLAQAAPAGAGPGVAAAG
ncbi:MAG: putative bifunctional diguanylate cyclase/phosphodiesterase [Hylemonella sp.]